MDLLTRTRQRLARFNRDQSGAVAVEFVLIAPLLFALLFGTVVVGYYIGVSHSVSQLATGAARASVAGLDSVEREALVQSYLAAANRRYPLLVQSALSSDVVMEGPSPAAITVSVAYAVEDSILDLANGFLGLDIGTITKRAYLAY